MNHKLVFESAWDRTIAPQDREKIIKIFSENSNASTEEIQFTTLKIAKNHKDELLVTVLVHNGTDKDFIFLDQTMTFQVEGKKIAKHTFNHPSLLVKLKTSMPWTFIFPVGAFKIIEKIDSGILTLE